MFGTHSFSSILFLILSLVIYSFGGCLLLWGGGNDELYRSKKKNLLFVPLFLVLYRRGYGKRESSVFVDVLYLLSNTIIVLSTGTVKVYLTFFTMSTLFCVTNDTI